MSCSRLFFRNFKMSLFNAAAINKNKRTSRTTTQLLYLCKAYCWGV